MILGSYSHQVLDISTINPSHASYKTTCSTCHLAGLLVVRSIIIQQAVIISIKFLTRGGKSTAPMERYKGEMDKTWEVFCGPTLQHQHTSERTSLIQYMRLKPMNICAIVKTWYMGYGYPSYIGNQYNGYFFHPIDGCMTIPFYEKTNHVLTTAHMKTLCSYPAKNHGF